MWILSKKLKPNLEQQDWVVMVVLAMNKQFLITVPMNFARRKPNWGYQLSAPEIESLAERKTETSKVKNGCDQVWKNHVTFNFRNRKSKQNL